MIFPNNRPVRDLFSIFRSLYDVIETSDTMKAKVRLLFEMISGAILSLLGFTSCEIISPRCEYGMPYANFKVNGEVKAADTGKPIEGIAVKFHRNPKEESEYDCPQFQTDKDGKVNETLTLWPEAEDIMLTFEDIDGEEHGGLFAPDTLRAKDLKITFVEDKKSTWHQGDYDITFEAKLKKADKQ